MALRAVAGSCLTVLGQEPMIRASENLLRYIAHPSARYCNLMSGISVMA